MLARSALIASGERDATGPLEHSSIRAYEHGGIWAEAQAACMRTRHTKPIPTGLAIRLENKVEGKYERRTASSF